MYCSYFYVSLFSEAASVTTMYAILSSTCVKIMRFCMYFCIPVILVNRMQNRFFEATGTGSPTIYTVEISACSIVGSSITIPALLLLTFSSVRVGCPSLSAIASSTIDTYHRRHVLKSASCQCFLQKLLTFLLLITCTIMLNLCECRETRLGSFRKYSRSYLLINSFSKSRSTTENIKTYIPHAYA